ncbi:hypothetical protein JCM10213_005913 [Rhodosporidiobolus nylandii]
MTTTDIELQSYASGTDTTHTPAQPTSFGSDGGERALDLARTTTRAEGDAPGINEQPATTFESYPDYPEDAWGQVLACWTLLATTLGGVYSWGVLQDALVARGVAPTATLAFIGSTQSTLQALLAILNSRLVAAYGPRRAALGGSLLCALALILASFCTNSLAGLVVTEGLMYGGGQGLVFLAAATLPSMYFSRRRNIATGLVYSGAGIGGAIVSIVAAQLLERLSLSWTLRILGLIFAVLNLPAALTLRTRAPKESFRSNKKIVDWTLFKDPRFALLLVGTAVGVFPLFVPPFFLPLYGTSIGLSGSTSSLLLAGFNLASAAGRIFFGVVADAAIGSLNSLVLCLTIVGVSTLCIWPFATTLAPLIAFAVVNGFCAGGMFSLIPGTLSSIFGSARLAVVFSMIITCFTPGYFLGAPVAGYLLDAFGGPAKYGAYRPAIFFSGGLSLFSALCVFAVRVYQSRRVFIKV